MEENHVPARTNPARPILTIFAAGALLLASCQGASPSPGASEAAEDSAAPSVEEPNELLVLEWAGYDEERWWADFKAASPETVLEWETGTNDADILAKMGAGSTADVVHFYTGYEQLYVDEGLVREIDTSKLTNWDKVPAEMQALGQIDGKQYFIPWDWGFTSILYNTEHVDEVTSWDALFNEDYAGHISMWDDGPGAVAVSSYIHGWDETAITEEQLAQIEQEWKDQKPLNLHYWDSEYENLCPEVISGDIWVAYAWPGCYATALFEGAPVAYANPEEGRNSWVGLYGISADTDSYELALQFLDLKLADLTCGTLVTDYYYGCANQDVMAAVEDPVLIEAFSIDDPGILETTNFTPPVTAEQRDAWTAMWTRVKAE
jgi:spermidine/putrescine transport system substrate-binding protein